MAYAYPMRTSPSTASPSSVSKVQREPGAPHHQTGRSPRVPTSIHPSPISSTTPGLDTSFDPSSSTVPPPTEGPPSPLTEPAAWFSYPISYAVNSIYRRVSAPPDPRLTGLLQAPGAARPHHPSPVNGQTTDMLFSRSRSRPRQSDKNASGHATPIPSRKASPFQPPPLVPLQLTGYRTSTPEKDRILGKALAEEIRLLVPPRLQLEATWHLCYSVEQDGASLATLYSKCEGLGENRSRAGFVIVIRDAVGGIFGAFLTDPPRPSSSYYGTGECFLWSSTIQTVQMILSHLPPPPSEDTTHMESRSTTLVSPTKPSFEIDLLGDSPLSSPSDNKQISGSGTKSQMEEEERMRFRAFPYSGVNDYMIYCEHSYLSVGGGDGKYGLWLDDRLDQGVSSPSLTFGNEALSEEGEKFEALGVEVWFLGS